MVAVLAGSDGVKSSDAFICDYLLFNTSILHLDFYGLHYDAVQRYMWVIMFRWNATSFFRHQILPKIC